MARKKGQKQPNPAEEALLLGKEIARSHPVCRALFTRIDVYRQEGKCPKDGWAVVCQSGRIYVHPSRRGEPQEWAYVLAHCALHLGFGHFADVNRQGDRAWQAACDVVIERFLTNLKLGTLPFPALPLPNGNEETLYRTFREQGVPPEILERGTGGSGPDMVWDGPAYHWVYGGNIDFVRILARGLTSAVEEAVEVAAGYSPSSKKAPTTAERAQRWFITNFPLLGAMAASFKIIEDPKVCQHMDIAVAAVCPADREIYINPAAALDEMECRFVIAHEILHVGLRHVDRCEGRDPFLWNVACDYVINEWILEMNIGTMPSFGGLHDPELKGLSAEAVYDRIVLDFRRFRKVATVRGVGLVDVLGPDESKASPGIDLDAFYRRCLAQGLSLHLERSRGLLPAGLIEEIEALSAPPIPWDVRLAQWFDPMFPALEPKRTYARASRRQSATPDIPRPRVFNSPAGVMDRTFGVVLDTSGSMDAKTLAKALGAVSNYALSREVPMVRLVFCDAAAYDEGYVTPESIAGRVRVRGRGGTVLQPGVDLLQRARDFPKDGPILIITDAYCDHVRSSRSHAYLVPRGARLPFVPRGPVFEMD